MTAAVETGIAPRAPEERALQHLTSLQQADGCWEGEVVWNTMLLAQYVMVHRVVGSPPFAGRERARMIRHFEVTRTPEGGWGMHPGSGPYVFFTTMAYVALRLLGVEASDPLAARARAWLHTQSVTMGETPKPPAQPVTMGETPKPPAGVLAIPTWGKVWLSLIGLHGWEGVNPVPPELFLLPRALPIHPDRYYCHTRYIYLAIAYLSGRRFTADLGSVAADLRRELYDAPYDTIDFAAHRHSIAAADLYVRPGLELRLAYDALRRIERVLPDALRRRALDHAFTRIQHELTATRFQCISPVNGLLNVLCVFDRDPRHPLLAPALRGVEAWRWEDEAEGVRFAGARSNAWDTAFALRAALEAPPMGRPVAAIRRGYAYLRDTQMVEDLPAGDRARERRDSIAGGWCFSDGQHRWPVSDCTAEALSAILLAHKAPGLIPHADRLTAARLDQAAQFILDRQNDDGGFGTYERRRGGPFLEALNPSEMYGACMTERSYLECTASSIGALARFRAVLAGHDALGARLDRAVARGAALIRRAQQPDGAWAGFWGVNFTYGIFHAVEGLRAAGAAPSDPALARAARWLEDRQKPDGGWGERHESCLDGRYQEHPESQVIMTSWALLALLHAGRDGRSAAVRRGVAFLRGQQRGDGSFPEQAVAGVFFGTAMLHYRLYRAYFPAWALARAAQ